MFRMILATQWKWTRTMVLFATIIGFAIPLASLQSSADAFGPTDYVHRMQRYGVGYALLAAGIGLMVALAAWGHDQRGRHVYALTLPVSRARYVLLRLAAGAVFLAPPVIAVLFGSLLVAAFGSIPAGLHAYPVALTLRFAFAALVAYSLVFAIGSSTQKTAGIILGVIAALVLTQYVLAVADIKFDLLRRVTELLFLPPGVLSVFSGRWTLVDA